MKITTVLVKILIQFYLSLLFLSPLSSSSFPLFSFSVLAVKHKGMIPKPQDGAISGAARKAWSNIDPRFRSQKSHMFICYTVRKETKVIIFSISWFIILNFLRALTKKPNTIPSSQLSPLHTLYRRHLSTSTSTSTSTPSLPPTPARISNPVFLHFFLFLLYTAHSSNHNN